MYKGKGVVTECKTAEVVKCLLNVVGKIYTGILVDTVRRVTGRLIDDEQGGFRASRGSVQRGGV